MNIAAPARPLTDRRPAEGTGRSEGLRLALVLLPIVAVGELLLVRTFYRVGVYIPKDGVFGVVHRVATQVGSFLLNASSLLAVIVVGWFAARAFRAGRRSTAMALGLALAGMATALVAGDAVEVRLGVRLTFALAALALIAPFLRESEDRVHRAAVMLVAGAMGLAVAAGASADASAAAFAGTVGVEDLQLAAEAVAVIAAFALAWSWLRSSGPSSRAFIAGALAGAALVAFRLANGSLLGILVLWTAGMRLYLPVWVYGLAAAAAVAAAAGWFRENPHRAIAVILLPVAGLLLDSTYQQSLALVALLLLTDGMAVGGLPALRRVRSA